MFGRQRSSKREDVPAEPVRFTVEADGVRRSVFFEPEGAEVALSPDASLTVEISGGHGRREVELTIHERGLSVWAWSGAETAAWDRSGVPLDI